MARTLTARPRPSQHRKDAITSNFIDENYTARDRAADFAHVVPSKKIRNAPKSAAPHFSEPKGELRETRRTSQLRDQMRMRQLLIAHMGGSITVKEAPHNRPRSSDAGMARAMEDRVIPSLDQHLQWLASERAANAARRG